MKKWILPITEIAGRPAGSAVFCWAQQEGEPREISFLVREDSNRISQIAGPLIEIRVALLLEGRVQLMPIMVRIGKEVQENIFETWFNFCQDGGLAIIKSLATQPRIALIFFGDSGNKERAIEVVNSWSSAFDVAGRILYQHVAKKGRWSMLDFDIAREKIYTKYPSVIDLWKKIQE